MKTLHRFVWLTLAAPVLAVACSSDADNYGAGANAIGGSQGKPAGSPAAPGPGTASAEAVTSNGFEVVFVGSQANPDGTSTWRYRVNETPCAQDLSNWVLEVFDCTIVGASPEPNEVVRPDPNAKLTGVKWETGGGFTSGEFSVTVSGPARADTIRFGVKGPDVELGQTIGPRCSDAVPPVITDARRPPRGKNRCPDASVPPPPPPPDAGPPPVDVTSTPDAGSDGSVCTLTCAEDVPCPPRYLCDLQGCCQPEIR